MSRVRVIGCGNPDAGDDALGLLAVRASRGRLPGSVEVVEAGSAARAIDLLQDVDAVVLVDAIIIEGAVGNVGAPDGAPRQLEPIRLDASSGQVPAGVRTSLSSHGLGLAEAFMLAAAVGPLPHIVVLGLEAREMEVGRPLSPEVSAGFDGLVDAIVSEATALSEATR